MISTTVWLFIVFTEYPLVVLCILLLFNIQLRSWWYFNYVPIKTIDIYRFMLHIVYLICIFILKLFMISIFINILFFPWLFVYRSTGFIHLYFFKVESILYCIYYMHTPFIGCSKQYSHKKLLSKIYKLVKLSFTKLFTRKKHFCLVRTVDSVWFILVCLQAIQFCA